MSKELRGGFQADGTYIIQVIAKTVSPEGESGYYPPAVGTIITTHKGLLEVLGIVEEFEPKARPHLVRFEYKISRTGYGWRGSFHR